MARTLVEAAITTRSARSKLSIGLHWRGLDPDIHLGYRKGRRGGVWLVRWRDGRGYRQAPIGTADDELSEGTLDFPAAQRAARQVVASRRADASANARGPALTVGDAVATYVAKRDARDSRRVGRSIRSDAASRLRKYVTGREAVGRRPSVEPAELSSAELHRMADRDLREWLDALPVSLKATTRRRLVNDLKAALNAAYSANRDRLPPGFPATVKYGLALAPATDDVSDDVARESQILSDQQVGALVRAAHEVDDEDGWSGDLFRLVVSLAATGARFSQIARMRVRDCQIEAKRLLVPASRKGKSGKPMQLTTVPIGDDVIQALVPVVDGRAADAPLLERWRHRLAPSGIAWERDKRDGWRAPAELARPWNSIRAKANLPNAIPYALRHSSIVRSIRANLPIRLVAAQHDTSVAMIEKHYARWISGGLEDMTRAAIVPLVTPHLTSSPDWSN